MFSQFRRRIPGLRSRRRAPGRRMQMEDLEGRALLTAIPLNFGATVASAPAAVGNELFFAASDATHGVQLWETNGTAAGTVRLTDGNDANGGIDPGNLTAVGNTVYFTADDGVHGDQIWESNGTAAGTAMVTDSTGLNPYDLTDADGTLYFDASGPDGVQLFESNGTAAGTVMVTDIPGTSSHPGCYPADLTAAGGSLYFAATEGGDDTQLWMTDGTAAGTVPLTSGGASSGGTMPQSLSWAGGPLYFTGYDATNKFQLWTSNGTTAGTYRVTSGNATTTGLDPQFVTATPGGTVYFAANDGVHGTQLWSSNGTTATMLTDVNVAGGGLSPTDLTMVGDELYFAGDGVDGTQLWESNGTAAGTAMVADINGTTTAGVTDITDAGGTVYFVASTQQSGFQIWQTNGTASGTVMDTQLATGTTMPGYLTAVGNDLYFTAPGADLWEWIPSATATATFVKEDTTTSGNWIGTYGTQGYDALGYTADLPSYATVTTAGTSYYVQSSSTTDTRALESPATYPTPDPSANRVAATWFGSSFSVTVDLTDGQAHDVALYAVDWGGDARVEQIQVSTTTGTVLDTRTISTFHAGVYLQWTISGDVVFTVTLSSGANAVLNGLFFDPTATATFVKEGTTTSGNWIGTYGTQGYDAQGYTADLPSYATVTTAGTSYYVQSSSTTDTRALESPATYPTPDPSANRVAATWFGSSFSVTVDLTDGQAHDIALYMVDWGAMRESSRSR